MQVLGMNLDMQNGCCAAGPRATTEEYQRMGGMDAEVERIVL